MITLVSPVDLRKVAKSLYDNKYVDVYAFLTVSLDNLRSRGTLLNNDIQELEKRLKEMVERANAEPERMNPDDVEICSLFKELQYVEMDIIQRLSILAELLAVFYWYQNRFKETAKLYWQG